MQTQADEEFSSFVAARWTRMVRTAYALTGNHHDAEDLVQQTMANAYARWGRVSGADNPDAYVWRMVLNANVDRLRRARLREWLTTRIPDTPQPDPTHETDRRSVLLSALRRLPRRQREAVILRYVADLSETQAAAVLGSSVGTVKSQASRGLAKLRQDGALAELVPVTGGRAGAGPGEEPR
ncbi:SigE family RNA polymerase sigma factor [Allostreptomyces psammosilenae]|uniref:RNA polymerase sigma-70 factor (Sigma-E family) n=1 Tax=Allostreptomyces psammosilenae TaxID=1892865 RepID=A0A853A1Y1_9ACTN|nr:SigE family RNA polymerase sigma factor [Allostreptomyces psammosilenae]NYI04522.1 RNA polymerase sigma-70 factor (sigma-E family) [Allostreptomyces psammosilenae]